MDEWKDITTYSQGDKERIPSVYEFTIGGFRVAIHRHMDYEKDRWLVSCDALRINKIKLSNKDIEKAKLEGLQFVNNVLRNYSLLHHPIEREIEKLNTEKPPFTEKQK